VGITFLALAVVLVIVGYRVSMLGAPQGPPDKIRPH
jgi:hypothetical protein